MTRIVVDEESKSRKEFTVVVEKQENWLENRQYQTIRLGELMQTVQSKGFIFLMDDFGSEYSSLNMLRNIPVDILKLDLHFLGFSEGEASGKIIMESVI